VRKIKQLLRLKITNNLEPTIAAKLSPTPTLRTPEKCLCLSVQCGE